MSTTWYLRSTGDRDTPCGQLPDSDAVVARCGIRFQPRPLPGGLALPGHPQDRDQICPDCYPAVKWVLSVQDYRYHAIDEQAEHSHGVYHAACGRLLLTVTATELQDEPGGAPGGACTVRSGLAEQRNQPSSNNQQGSDLHEIGHRTEETGLRAPQFPAGRAPGLRRAGREQAR